MKHSKTNVGIICIFFLLLWLPLIDMNFHFIKVTNTEKRALAQIPSFRDSSLSTFITYYEKYYNDNFGFRSFLIWLYNFTQVKILHTSPVQKVMIGTNGWLFYNSEVASDDHSIDDYEGKVRFTDKELELIHGHLLQIQKKLAEDDIRFIVFVAPNKSSIYDAFLPSGIRTKKGTSRYDQVYGMLKKDKDMQTIDAKNILLTQRSKEITYYKTDTHWNSNGAFWVYQNLLPQLDITPHKRIDYHIIEKKNNGPGDLAEMLGLKGQFTDYEYIYTLKKRTHQITDVSHGQSRTVIKTMSESDAPKLLVFRDSFFTALEPFTSEHFSRSTYVWTTYDQNVVDQEKPDIVIWEVAERYIDRLLK